MESAERYVDTLIDDSDGDFTVIINDITPGYLEDLKVQIKESDWKRDRDEMRRKQKAERKRQRQKERRRFQEQERLEREHQEQVQMEKEKLMEIDEHRQLI